MNDEYLKDLQVKLAAILTTLEETGGAPESIVYLALDCTLDEWDTLKYILVHDNLCEVEYNFVTLTDKGHALAKQINAAISE